MKPIENLATLIKEMTPELDSEKLYFCTTSQEQQVMRLIPHAFAMVRETEGVTLILREAHANEVVNVQAEPFARIELKVFSSLEAVGLTAAFSQCLKSVGISANVIAGFHHDHILVPWRERNSALSALQALSHREE